jgi:predicted HTH domain antitoxin
MQILVDVPAHFPDAAHCSPQEFERDARMAMAVKLFELKRLSSGMAAALVGIPRVQFLRELYQYGVPVIDFSDAELESDLAHA